MSTEGSYYVPEQSKLPLLAALGIGTMAFGAASWVIEGGTSTVFLIGTAIMAAVMYKWWSVVIEENTQGIVSDQLKYSYVSGHVLVYFLRIDVLCVLLWIFVLCEGIGRALDWWRSCYWFV